MAFVGAALAEQLRLLCRELVLSEDAGVTEPGELGQLVGDQSAGNCSRSRWCRLMGGLPCV